MNGNRVCEFLILFDGREGRLALSLFLDIMGENVIFEQKTVSRKYKTRTRTRIGCDGVGRADRIEKRNRVLVARWYYWTECQRLRSDDAILRLCDEFFIEQRTVTNVLLKEDEYFRQLLRSKATAQKLSKEYSSFNWGVK